MMRYIRRLFAPLPLIVLISSAVTISITGIWWIIPLGLLAAGIIALQGLPSDTPPGSAGDDPAPYDLSSLHYDLRAKFGSILEEREKISKELEESPENTFLNADEISSRLNEIVDRYYHLLLKLEKIRPFIDQSVMTAAKKSMDELKARIERCSDDVTHENLTLALKNKADQMNSLAELARFRDRVESQLVNLIATMNSLHIRIVQVKLSPDSSLDPTAEIKESINNILLNIEFSENASREFHRFLAGGAP